MEEVGIWAGVLPYELLIIFDEVAVVILSLILPILLLLVCKLLVGFHLEVSFWLFKFPSEEATTIASSLFVIVFQRLLLLLKVRSYANEVFLVIQHFVLIVYVFIELFYREWG